MIIQVTVGETHTGCLAVTQGPWYQTKRKTELSNFQNLLTANNLYVLKRHKTGFLNPKSE